MTCVVGLVDVQGGVHLGADSCAGETSQYLTRASAVRKLGRCGEYLVGYTWTFRFGQLLALLLPTLPDPGPRELGIVDHLVRDLVPALRARLREGGALRREHELEQGGQCLVAWRGQLAQVESDFSVLEYRDRFSAVGSGMQFALGALSALTSERPEMAPARIVEAALRASARHSAYVRPPFLIFSKHHDGSVDSMEIPA